MILYHGEDIAGSRAKLNQYKEEQIAAGNEVLSLNGKILTLTDLRQAVESVNLLGSGRAVIIEGLLTAPKSKRQEEILAYLKNHPDDQIVLWESRQIPPGKIKSLGAKAQEFTLPKILFTFLESVGPKNTSASLKLLKQLLGQQPAELVLFMLGRQVRQLLVARFEPELLTGPSWLSGKTKAQAGKFTPNQLLALHENLYLVDQQTKTGQSLLPLADRLTQLILMI